MQGDLFLMRRRLFNETITAKKGLPPSFLIPFFVLPTTAKIYWILGDESLGGKKQREQ